MTNGPRGRESEPMSDQPVGNVPQSDSVVDDPKTEQVVAPAQSRFLAADWLLAGTVVVIVGIWLLTRFVLVPSDDSHALSSSVMPQKVEDEAERELYLVPGGMYSEEDIAANEGATPSTKFAGFRAAHDFNPQPGDPVCPITRTKANPDCTWVIAGREYAFCCPPCIDEFVQRAKDEPERIAPPETYVR
jgi:YHS domain-containing protein